MATFVETRINGERKAVPVTGTPGAVVVRESSGKVPNITGGTASGEVLTYDQIGSVVSAYATILDNIAALSSTGLICRIGSGSVAARTLSLGSSLSGSNLDGAGGNPSIDTVQDIRTTASVRFMRLGLSGTSANASVFAAIGTSQAAAGQSSHMELVTGTGALTDNKLVFGVCDGSYAWLQATHPGTAYRNLALQPSGGNIIVGGTVTGSGASSNLVLTGTGTLGAALADAVSLCAPDNGAGNAEFQVQPESGGILAWGANTLRRVYSSNGDAVELLARVTVTDGTQTTIATIAITAGYTYYIEAIIAFRRTGGASGTADDQAVYIKRASYSTKSGTVTVGSGGVVSEHTDEDQATFDSALTISGSNVLVRGTGATANNLTMFADVKVVRIAA